MNYSFKSTNQNPIRSTNAANRARLFGMAAALLFFGVPLATQARPAPDGDIGNGNTAGGAGALANITTGTGNTANGSQALFFTTSGSFNTATGYGTLGNNTNNWNTATGNQALTSNTAGAGNTGDGSNTLWMNTTGNYNTALGYYSGSNLSTGSYNIDIANNGVAGESGTIRIGTAGNQNATFVAGINGTAVAGAPVVIDANGQLGVAPSSERFKDQIKSMDKTSEALLDLKPVTFRYKNEIDPNQIPQFGLLAEEVAKVDPDLVARDSDGKVYTVRYEAVNAMLLNEFLKQHRRVQKLEETIAQLKSAVAKQETAIARQRKQRPELRNF